MAKSLKTQIRFHILSLLIAGVIIIFSNCEVTTKKKLTEDIQIDSTIILNMSDSATDIAYEVDSLSEKIKVDFYAELNGLIEIRTVGDTIYYLKTLKSLPGKFIDSIQFYLISEGGWTYLIDSMIVFNKNNNIQKFLFDYHVIYIDELNKFEDVVCFTHLNNDDFLDFFIPSTRGGNGGLLGEVYVYSTETNSFQNDSLLSGVSYLAYNKKKDQYCSHGRSSAATYSYEIFKVVNNQIVTIEKLEVTSDKVSNRIRIHTKKEKIKKRKFKRDYPLEEYDSLTKVFINFPSEECIYVK